MPSRKQRAILSYIGENGRITLAEAVDLVGGDIYCNKNKRVGAILLNMVRRGMIKRIKRGVYEVAE